MTADLSGEMFREFANEDLTKDKEKYEKFSKIARQLNSGEIDLNCDPFLIDCVHQPHRGRKEYNHIDAYLINLFFDDFYRGNILFAILKTKDKAYSDHKKEKNNKSLNSAVPFHGKFDSYDVNFSGGKGYCDGYLNFKGEVIFNKNVSLNETKITIVNKFDGVLEVGSCDISTVWVHLFVNQGHLARFPYNHNKIGLFIKTNYKGSIDDPISLK